MSRLGSSKAIGPNVQLTIFHDANAIVGVALAIALHGSGAACEPAGEAKSDGMHWVCLACALNTS